MDPLREQSAPSKSPAHSVQPSDGREKKPEETSYQKKKRHHVPVEMKNGMRALLDMHRLAAKAKPGYGGELPYFLRLDLYVVIVCVFLFIVVVPISHGFFLDDGPPIGGGVDASLVNFFFSSSKPTSTIPSRSRSAH